ncbi:hypothetical protein [Runella sp.]|uniref:hypothetical protein n=1 Tax=Runella sp. TaxID=1960881 RepID=UPI003D1147F9
MVNLKKYDIWNSSTLMTWLSYSTKSLSLLGVLPLILQKFSPGDVVLWYLFSTLISLQSLADFGFRQTFTRIISFAFGGAENIDVIAYNKEDNSQKNNSCNNELLAAIIASMIYIYKRLTIIAFFLMLIFGTWAMIKPISNTGSPTQAWISWGIILFTTCISFFLKIYTNFLEGLNKIALVRRVETFTSLGAIISSIAVLIWAPTLLNVVITNQIWVLISSARDYILCNKVEGGLFKSVNKNLAVDKYILKKIWAPAWRSGIGGVMSAGVTNIISVLYAQFGSTDSVASYLLAIRIITQIREVSMAPFYSKLPLLAVYRVRNDVKSLIETIRKGMRLSHSVFFAGFILVAVFIDPLLQIIHSEVKFVPMQLWALLGWAFFIHRFGAMHIQVYLSTNHIISHIADGISGVLFIVSAFLLSSYLNVYAIPVSMLIGYGTFYIWYTSKYSYRSLGIKSFWQFEKKVSFPSAIGFTIFSIVTLFLY